MTKHLLAAAIMLVLAAALSAHDTWVQTNTNVVRAGDYVHIDLMLGNHGNDHRDFKLASKIDLEGCTLTVVAPDGKRYDLKDRLTDTGYTPKEGYWTARFAGALSGSTHFRQGGQLRSPALSQERQNLFRYKQEPGQRSARQSRV
ncbi:MAG TPA: DUF4198 domain-containing protein [Gemmataceae bacterium]|nr:DUF4198 domain-containing protein [Gemmataceae bacterium]